jgi:hypothetical protein
MDEDIDLHGSSQPTVATGVAAETRRTANGIFDRMRIASSWIAVYHRRTSWRGPARLLNSLQERVVCILFQIALDRVFKAGLGCSVRRFAAASCGSFSFVVRLSTIDEARKRFALKISLSNDLHASRNLHAIISP